MWNSGRRLALGAALALLCAAGVCAQSAPLVKVTALTPRGAPKYAAGFTHFEYVNPSAPKGGSITQAALGSFDNFHRYALRGRCAEGSEYLYDTLMRRSLDETGVLYPAIAESAEYTTDYSSIIFNINKNARDQEGQPLTAHDVAFSFRIIFERGVPQFRAYYADVSVRALDDYRVQFTLAGGEKQKMIDLADLSVFPRRFWESPAGETLHDFSEPLSTPPVGTGPYRVADYQMGQFVVLERVKNWWAADLPVNKGCYNFDTLRYDYYHDSNVSFEAFKAGEYDFRRENSARNWATGYTGKRFDSGAIVRAALPNGNAAGMSGLVFNVQRPIFADRRVRQALGFFLDFNWMNKNLFYSLYKRPRSYFQNTVYAAQGLPSAAELRELEPLRGSIPPEVFTTPFEPPETEGGGYIRPQAREALRLFAQAGWQLKNGTLVNAEGARFSFEVLIYDESSERVLIPLRNNLERYGIDMHIRMVDTSQFVNRMRSRDYDMISAAGYPFNSPNPDLLLFWHSSYIDSTYNAPGVTDPAIDRLCEQIAAAQEDDERLTALGRALDRVLTWNFFCIPEWYSPNYLIAYARRFAQPAIRPLYDIGLDTWWEVKN